LAQQHPAIAGVAFPAPHRWAGRRVCGYRRLTWRIVEGWPAGSPWVKQDRTTQDEELAVTERSRGLPTPSQVIELLGGEFVRAGYEIEDVAVDTGTRPPRITVVADGDRALDLTTIADLSRVASDLLDGVVSLDSEYVLEVSSPGVERPLTTEKHFRRAHGRKVEVELTDGTQVTGRVGALDDGVLALVIHGRKQSDWSVRELALADITKAIVQVEFSPPNQRELELVGGQTGDTAGAARTEAGT
jgi:ribosome maturation factor RimP